MVGVYLVGIAGGIAAAGVASLTVILARRAIRRPRRGPKIGRRKL